MDLGATECIPCKMMAPILKERKQEYQGRAAVIFLAAFEKLGVKRQPLTLGCVLYPPGDPMDRVFLAVNECLAAGNVLAMVGSLLWGMISALFSSCHVAAEAKIGAAASKA